MSAVSSKLRRWVNQNDGEAGYTYWCQGCDQLHQVTTEGGQPNREWGFNGDLERPTFTPSVLTQYDRWEPPVTPENLAQWREKPWPQERKHHVCHTFITDGQVQFLGDCTHALAGKTEPLPDLPDYLKE